jgi:phosphoribosylaminoimidazole-succinocarboxamide synthase
LEKYNNTENSRILFVKKCKVFPIEFVMRGYMTGSTNTSIWKNYEKGSRTFCGHYLRNDYVKNEKLDEILLTPTTKSDDHDINISEKNILERGIMTKDEWDICKKFSYELFRHGQVIAEEKGMILVDTKYEFGKGIDGKIYLVDELHTPDSSRYWIKHNYEERFKRGFNPDQISKEFVRQWVRENIGNPYDPNVKIELPKQIIERCSNVYKCLEEILCS